MPTDRSTESSRRAQRQDHPTAEQLLAQLRAGGTGVEHAQSLLAFVPSEAARDGMRAEVTVLLAASLQPSDRDVTRWLLDQETMRLRAAGQGASEALYTLVAALARFGSPQDALAIWRAREATPQTRAGVDVEQMGRLGVDAVREVLRSIRDAGGADASEAAEALAWLEDDIALGAFADLAAYFAWADERFGLHVSGPV